MSKPIIVIGIPCFAGVEAETLEDYMRFAYYLGRRYQEYNFALAIKSKTEQFRARNAIVQEAQQINADYLLFLDDDHVIDIDGIIGPSEKYEFLRKMIAHEKDIVGALYWQRGGTYNPVALMEAEQVVEGVNADQYRLLNRDEVIYGPQEVDVVGGGCMLIKMSVFDKIPQPYFEPEHTYSTDIQLCRAAKKAGCSILLDSSIELGHIIKEKDILHTKTIDRVMKERSERIERQKDPTKFKGIEHHPAARTLMRIVNEFTDDVMEYLNIETHEELAKLADSHKEHQQKFKEFPESEEYYRAAGRAYLARACFIHHPSMANMVDRNILFAFTNGGDTCIDYGCGAAPITFELCLRGYKVYFYDIEGNPCFEFLKWRSDKYNLTGKNAFFQKEMPGFANTIFCLDVIEHLANWREIIDKLAEVLVEGGQFISNFIILGDRNNPEHIFMDKPLFLQYAAEQGLWQISNIVWQKRKALNMTSVKENSK